MRIGTFLVLILLKMSSQGFAQQTHIDIGLRSQKSFGLYLENGLVAHFSNDSILNNRLHFGLGYVSSRFGSAIGSNAIKQDNFQLWLAYYFKKDHALQPFFSLGTGYFTADYELDDFDALDHNALLLSLNAGLQYNFPSQVKINLGLGYNLTAGDGQDGPGTLYPVFAQFNFFYPLK